MDLDCTDPAGWLPIDVVRISDRRFARLNVTGELDASTSPRLLSAVRQAVSPEPPEWVELNLAELSFIDSAGIRCLLECRAVVHEARGRLMLVDPRPHVVRSSEITGLAAMFGLAPEYRSGWSHRGRRASPHRPRSLEELFEDSVALREAAQGTVARARAARSAGLIQQLRRD